MHTLETTSFRENYGFRFDCPIATLGSTRLNCKCIADLTVDKFVGGLLSKLIKLYSDAVKIKIVFFWPCASNPWESSCARAIPIAPKFTALKIIWEKNDSTRNVGRLGYRKVSVSVYQLKNSCRSSHRLLTCCLFLFTSLFL